MLSFGAVKAMVRRGSSPNLQRICERRSTSIRQRCVWPAWRSSLRSS